MQSYEGMSSSAEWTLLRKYVDDNYQYYTQNDGGILTKGFDEIFNVDVLSFTNIILTVIVESRGAEYFDSIGDTLVREQIAMKIQKMVKDAKNEIFDEDEMNELYFTYVWEGEVDEDAMIEKGMVYRPALFVKALRNIYDSGKSITVTNWRHYEKDVWAAYKKLEIKSLNNTAAKIKRLSI